MIRCTQYRGTGHTVFAFRDTPRPTESNDRHECAYLNGTNPIFDLRDLMESGADETAIVLVRTVE